MAKGSKDLASQQRPFGSMTLEDMLRNQYRFEEILANKGKMQYLGRMTNEERIQFVKENLFALDHEGHELINNTSWKFWADGDRFDREACVAELADMFAFLFNIALAVCLHDPGDPEYLDIDEDPEPYTVTELAEEVGKAVAAKVEVNIERQSRPQGYKGVGGI